MPSVTEVRVPDLGDFADVPIIEIHVAQGGVVNEEDPLITLESDKATMDVPSPAAGTVGELRVKVGDLIEVKEKSKQLAFVLESTALGERDVPDYIDVDHTKMTAKLTRVPTLGDVPYPVVMEPHLVVEYYSR